MKKKLIQATVLLIFAFMAFGSASTNNMSEQDAYNVGYGAGTLLRNMSK